MQVAIGEEFVFAGVYDGHGGVDAAAFAEVRRPAAARLRAAAGPARLRWSVSDNVMSLSCQLHIDVIVMSTSIKLT